MRLLQRAVGPGDREAQIECRHCSVMSDCKRESIDGVVIVMYAFLLSGLYVHLGHAEGLLRCPRPVAVHAAACTVVHVAD